jgi:apolipoprotein N-acyltransferase
MYALASFVSSSSARGTWWINMLYTFGRILFPSLLNQEKKLRARMRWVTVIASVILVGGVVGLCCWMQQARTEGVKVIKPHTTRVR